VPIVSAQFTERLTNATGFAGQAASYTAGVNLAWRLDVPTFMNMSSQSATEQVALLATERARLVARDQVNFDWQRLQAALIKVDAAKAQVEAARRATQVARDRYAAGAATQVDVIQAERDVFGAEVGQIQARTELASARASLRLSAALPLE
jgi:outer membrane protein TolC